MDTSHPVVDIRLVRGASEPSEYLTEQLRPLVEILRANERRATSIQAQERIRQAIELFEEFEAGQAAQCGAPLPS